MDLTEACIGMCIAYRVRGNSLVDLTDLHRNVYSIYMI